MYVKKQDINTTDHDSSSKPINEITEPFQDDFAVNLKIG